MPPSTFDAFRDHGNPRPSLTEDLEAAHDTMADLEKLGISMPEITDTLLCEGVQLFAAAFDTLLRAVDTRCRETSEVSINRQTYTLPQELASQVEATLNEWRSTGKVRRLWRRDASL